jgi:SAM-dependent methyltransferase
MNAEVIWHDVECGGYAADLPLWEELTAEHGGPILELGCGSGRVVVHLARTTGELVIGLDTDDELVAAVWDRAVGLEGDAEIGDVRGFALQERFQLVIAPMQLIQLLPERTDRVCCLSCVADHLRPGGRAAFAIVEGAPALPEGEIAPPTPDVKEVGDWVYSSLPLIPDVREGTIILRRLRQAVSPDGTLSEKTSEVVLQQLSAEMLEQEATEMGLTPIGRREIPATEAHVGSTVVLLEKEA